MADKQVQVKLSGAVQITKKAIKAGDAAEEKARAPETNFHEKQFEALRTEICQSIQYQHQILLTGYGGVGAVIVFSAKAKDPIIILALTVVLLLLFFAITAMWCFETNRMVRAGHFIGEQLEPHFASDKAKLDKFWESSLRDPTVLESTRFDTHHRWLQRISVLCMPICGTIVALYLALVLCWKLGASYIGAILLLITVLTPCWQFVFRAALQVTSLAHEQKANKAKQKPYSWKDIIICVSLWLALVAALFPTSLISFKNKWQEYPSEWSSLRGSISKKEAKALFGSALTELNAHTDLVVRETQVLGSKGFWKLTVRYDDGCVMEKASVRLDCEEPRKVHLFGWLPGLEIPPETIIFPKPSSPGHKPSAEHGKAKAGVQGAP